MTARRRNRAHAAKVAAAATLAVMACYALCALGLSVFVVHHLTAGVDSRLRARLATVAAVGIPSSAAAPAADGDGDLDDAPIFLWVRRGDRLRSLSIGAPALDPGALGSAPETVTIGGTPFRLDSIRVGTEQVFAGQSVASIARVASTLVAPEAGFGAVLVLATFCFALVVGLRASAPLELVRRRQAEFTADASHELRTPLSVLEAEVDLALRRPRSPEQYQEVLRRIGGEGRRLRRIVDDLLWLARVDGGQLPDLHGAPVDLAAVATACVDRFASLAARHDVQLDIVTDEPSPALVDAPAEWLDRLAGVLVDNAVKFAGEGGRVEVRVLCTATKVGLRIDDSGPGIPAAARATIFDRFRRASTDVAGAGLGLAIGDSVVRTTGGTWTVSDAPLGGARIEVEWRRAHETRRGPSEDVTAPDVRAAAGRTLSSSR